MCGIAGYIGKKTLLRLNMDNCVQLMNRRGPDSNGIYTHKYRDSQNVVLIHSRLSIIDLDDRANQPFKIKSRTLIYNGELYNYIELKKDLEAKGYTFKTESDTEVFLKILCEYGEAGLDRCEGMWALALYDETDGTLLLTRDRFGEKPLYLYENQEGLYFGSEIKFISALAGIKFEINFEHLYRYMVNGYKSLYKVRHTFFKDVRELPASHYAKYTPAMSPEVKKYWIPEFNIDNNMTYEDAVEGARTHLINSVKLRLRADVPLAFCMSGGVDSNALISIAKNIFNHDVHGFTVVEKDKRYDEWDMVERSVKELGIKHTPIHVNTNNFISNLKALINYHDAPVYTISYYAHWLLVRSIAENGYKISISGTAADELFTGYYDHYAMYLFEVRNNHDLFEKSLKDWKRHIEPVVRNPVLQDPEVFLKNSDERSHIYLDSEIFETYLKTHFHEKFSEDKYCDTMLRNRMLNEIFREVIPVILHEDDLNAMYFSVENRSPFLDRDLFEFCYSIPDQHLMGDGFNKKVLRDAMLGIVPDAILNNRQKIGFNASIYSFMDVRNAEVRDYLLDESPVFEHIHKNKIETLISELKASNSTSKFLFNFLCSKIFLEEFL